MTGCLALLSRDLRLVWRRPGDVAVVLAFFVVATVLFPLGIGPQANILAPLLGVTVGLPPEALIALAATLLVGTPTLSLIGGLAAALTLGARRGGALLALLALPLCVPTLIFGAAAIETLMTGEDLLAHIAILAALALVALATTPWAMAAALRQAGE